MRFLAADIGGTKTLLVSYKEKKKKLVEEKREKYVSQNYETLEAIIEGFLSDFQEPVDRACFGIAGPVKNQVAHATNLPWVVDAKKIGKRFSFQKCHLINDLEANAYGLNMIDAKDLLVINAGKEERGGNRALVSAGTGLGEAPIFYHKGEYVPSPSEGGHADFAPVNKEQMGLLSYLMDKFGHVSVERVLSGRGLINIYHYLLDEKIEKECSDVRDEMRRDDPAKVITVHAEKRSCKACERALDMFIEIYGQEVGNFALKTLATGGIFVGGGIAAKLSKQLKKGSFLKSFINKGRFSDFLKEIPIKIILNPDTALMGSVFYAKNRE